MSNHIRSIAVLAAGIILGALFTAQNTFPTANAQTESQSDDTTSPKTKTAELAVIPDAAQHPIFPATENSEVARVYATAYIVGEALRAGAIRTESPKGGGETLESRFKNFVGDIYEQLGGK